MRTKRLLLSAMILCAGISGAWADETKTGKGTVTTIPGTDNAAVTLNLDNYKTLFLTSGHGEVQNSGANFDFMCNGAYAEYNLSNSTEQQYKISFTGGTKNSGVTVTFTITNSDNETEYENTVSITNNGNWTYTSVEYSMTMTKALTTGDKVLKITFSNSSSYTTVNIGNIVLTPEKVSTYNVSASAADEKGTVSAPTSFAEGEDVKLTATPASVLYAFSQWTYSIAGGAEQTSTDNPLTISGATGDITATATFTESDGQSVPSTLDLTQGDFYKCKIENDGNIGYAYDGSSATYLLNNTTASQKAIAIDASYFQNNTVGYEVVLATADGTEVFSKSQSVEKGRSWTDWQTFIMCTPTLAVGKYVMTIKFSSTSDYSCNINKIEITDTTATDNITLDETATPELKAAENVTVVLNRKLVAGVWNTICLPFDMSAAQISSVFGDAKVAAMSTDSNSEKVSFNTVSEMEANKPYLIRVETANTTPANIKGVTISADGASTVSGSDVKFIGNYEANKTMTSENYFVYNNNIYKGGNYNTLNAFRAYFTTSAGAKLSISINGETVTAIEGIAADDNANGTAFNIAGQRVNDSFKGIVVKNGKKIIRK